MQNARNIVKENSLLLLALLVCAVIYGLRIKQVHISWDDPEMVFKNQDVQHFQLSAIFRKHYVGNYLPVTMLAHALMYFFFGSSDLAHHSLNLLLHLLNGVLVYKLSCLIFKDKQPSFISAVIFLLHPVQVESVAWISELKNILSTTFYLLGLLAWSTYVKNPGILNYFRVILYFLLGVLSKPSLIAFPLSLIALEFIFGLPFRFRTQINKLPLLLVSLLFGLLTIQTQSADLFINHSHEFPYWQRIVNSGVALYNYLLLFLTPVHLSIIYPFPEANLQNILTGCLFLLILVAVVIWLLLNKQGRWFGILCFVLFNFILVLQFLPFGEVLYADRYVYVPLIGLAWALSSGLDSIKLNSNVMAVVLIVLLGFLSSTRLKAWKSALVLYEDILIKYPNEFLALNSAGVECMFLNEDQKALDYFNRSVKAAPKNYKSYFNRGLLYLKNNKPNLAIQSFNQSLELYNYSKAYAGRASAYFLLGDLPKALSDAKQAIELDPKNAKAHFITGACYEKLNNLGAAKTSLNTCIELNPEDPDFYFKRAIVFGKQQNFTDCLHDLDVCLELKPSYTEAYYWRGVAKINLKLPPCEDFQKAAIENFEPAVSAFNTHCR